MTGPLLLAAALGLALLPSNVVPGAVPLLEAEWGVGALALGWVFSAYQIGYVASVVVLLPLTDRIGPRRIMIGGAALGGAAFVLFALVADDPWLASWLRAAAGFGLGGLYLPGVRVVADVTSPGRRNLVTGLYVSAFYLGSAASYGLTGALLPFGGWRTAAAVTAVLSCLAVPCAAAGSRGHRSRASGGGRLDLGVLLDRRVRGHLLAYVGHCWELYILRAWLAAFLASSLAARGAAPLAGVATGTQVTAAVSALGAAGVVAAGFAGDRFGRTRTALTILFVSVALAFLIGTLSAAPLALLVLVACLWGLLTAADSSLYSAAIVEHADPARVGSAQAIQGFLGFGATAVGPIVAGWILDADLGWTVTFATAGAGALLLSLPLAAVARRPRPKVADVGGSTPNGGGGHGHGEGPAGGGARG